jgi:hypothetical protein
MRAIISADSRAWATFRRALTNGIDDVSVARTDRMVGGRPLTDRRTNGTIAVSSGAARRRPHTARHEAHDLARSSRACGGHSGDHCLHVDKDGRRADDRGDCCWAHRYRGADAGADACADDGRDAH